MQILSRESPSATRKGGHHYPQCRLPSFASLIAAIGTGGYTEVSLRLRGLAVSRLPPVPITFVRCAHCGNQYWGLLKGQPPAGKDYLRSLRSLRQSVLGLHRGQPSAENHPHPIDGFVYKYPPVNVSAFSIVVTTSLTSDTTNTDISASDRKWR